MGRLREWLGLSKEAAADTNGVMVALVPSERASQALMDAAEATEPLENQHITLVYLGTLGDEVEDHPDVQSAVRSCVKAVAATYAPLNGEANGWGVFQNENDVLVALWNIPGVNGLRQALVEVLREEAGLPIKPNFSYTPHQTMSYLDPGEAKVPGRLDAPVRDDFMHLVLFWGGEQTKIPLRGLVKEAGPARGGNPDNPGQFSKEDRGYRKKDRSKKTDDKAKTETDPQEEARERAQQEPKERQPQESTPSTSEAPDATERGYTGVRYDDSKPSFTEEERKAHGDWYGHFLPEGKYPEGDPRNEPEFERIMEEKTALSDRYVNPSEEDLANGIGGQTEDLYDKVYDPASGKSNIYKPERARQHQAILKQMLDTYKDYPREGKAIVMAGPPGAGKSSFLKAHGREVFGVEVEEEKGKPPARNFVTINPDDFKEFIEVEPERYPGLEENELAAIKHEESSHLAKMATQIFMEAGYNVIIDITLGSAASATRKYYEPYADKYDFQVALVDGDMRNSLNNAGLRYKACDKQTGKRTYSGRFLPMSLIESNAPTKEGFRSKNAEQFLEFIKHDRVSSAVVYDPYNPEAGVQDAKAAVHQAEEVAKAAASLGIDLRSSILRTEGMMKMANETTEITQMIEQFNSGAITEEELVEQLVNWEYAAQDACPHTPGSPEWWQWHEDNGYQPGTFDEVLLARNKGLLPWTTFNKINDALYEAAPNKK